ncbi:hypothetical protein HYALB_00004654 [Hymenoscyphus albidus]|uniref:Uncharacterized protein n=1 Tax=Hymenoscyphus albidus TaxID=595503 RepID=A0A9N9LSF8_9HELO|nr:hypothetical protein HYALB_00004654 [Hymenoscyphus albidus]
MDSILLVRDLLNATEGANGEPVHHKPGPHITHVPTESISRAAPYSALILCIMFVVIFAVRHWLLEAFLLEKYYGTIYTSMDETNRRGFLNHHIAVATRLLIFITAAYPFIDVAFVSASLHSPYAGSKHVTMGDVLLVISLGLIAMYVFELFYRTKISPISAGHHIGVIMIGSFAIAISMDLEHQPDATIEFVLCLVWGAFDIISEFLPHCAIILYRVYPTRHNFLRKVFYIGMVSTFASTVLETILTMCLFGSLWDRWSIGFKVATPMLHVLFASCQLWGTWIFYKMMKKQERLINEQSGMPGDMERALMREKSDETQSVSKKSADVVTREISSNSQSPGS